MVIHFFVRKQEQDVVFNMKKISILLFTLFLVTGCDVKYKLHIGNKQLDENISILEINSLISKTDVSKQLDKIEMFNFDDSSPFGYYIHQKVLGDTSSGLDLSATYSDSTFNQYAVLIDQCYDTSNLVYGTNIITLNTSKTFKCFDQLNGGSIAVMISTDYYVIESNADQSSNEVYTWNLKAGADNTISIKISKTNPNPDKINEFLNNDYAAIIVIFGTIGVLIVIAYGIYKLKTRDE